MGTFTQKTNYLKETKSMFKDRLNSLGASITSSTTFRNYLTFLDTLYNKLDQMTIIGLPDSLEGKCEQNGTPTPSSPVPVETTTGRQEVVVCGKNLFDKNTTNILNANLSNSKINSSANERVFFMKCKPNTTYTFSISLPNSYKRNTIATTSSYPNFNMTIDNAVYSATAPKTYTTGANAEYIVWLFYSTSNPDYTEQQTKDSMMIELGSTTTTYEAYNGTTKEINLGKNLVKSARVDSATSIYNVTLFVEADLEPSTTYTFSFNGTNGNRIYANENLFTTGPYINITNDRVVITLTTKDTISKSDTRQYNSSYQKWVIFKNGKNEDSANVYDNLMIEKGNVATSYSPYKTPIYLGEMRNTNNVVIAKDYIFKNTTENPNYDSNLEEGQWYIHKEVGKVVLNGSENWVSAGNNTYAYDNEITNYLYVNQITIICDYYNAIANGTYGTVTNNSIRFRYHTDNNKSLYIRNNDLTSLANFKTWLGTHNTSVYYVLNTPTTTLIEDEELVNQLNQIEMYTVISEDFYN